MLSRYLKNKRGEISGAIQLLFLVFFLMVALNLLFQNRLFDIYHSNLDELVRVYVLKPMEEQGGFTNEMWASFQDELLKRGIDPNEVILVDATMYPVDRGEPVEISVTSKYRISALAFFGGPVIDRPTPIRKIGVSQRFFR